MSVGFVALLNGSFGRVLRPAPLSKTPVISHFQGERAERGETAARLGQMGRRDGGSTWRGCWSCAEAQTSRRGFCPPLGQKVPPPPRPPLVSGDPRTPPIKAATVSVDSRRGWRTSWSEARAPRRLACGARPPIATREAPPLTDRDG